MRPYAWMPWPLRWFLRIADRPPGAVLMLSAVVAYTVRQSFPQMEGSLRLPGLSGNVEIYRDKAGIPHIYADTADDLFMAQGYVHAQDRFWEMDFRRHVTAGRLSELFGAATLDNDKVIRTMGWRRVAEQELPDADRRRPSATSTPTPRASTPGWRPTPTPPTAASSTPCSR